LPGNRWGIEPSDGDPTMHRLLREHFGRPVSSLAYESDRFLRGEWLRRVQSDPDEYLRKCQHGYWLFSTESVYPGEFLELGPEPGELEDISGDVDDELVPSPIDYLQDRGPGPFARWKLNFVGFQQGRWVVQTGLLLLPLVLVWGLWRREVFWVLLALAEVYQLALCMLTYAMSSYTANVYLCFLLTSVLGVSVLVDASGLWPGRTGRGWQQRLLCRPT
jgi:hypothetical protein